MKKSGFALSLSLLMLLFTAACSSSDHNADTGKAAAFVTYLGNDTLAVEQFEKTEKGLTARVALRSPRTTLSAYELVLDDMGGMQSMSRTNYPLSEGFEGEGTLVQQVERNGDSLRIEYFTDEGTRTFMTAYEDGVLPFIDMVHWPYELAFNRAVSMDSDTVNQPLLSGRRISNFVIADISGDSMTVRHPSRGVMGVHVDDSGNLDFLDAGLTTRKLKVYRQPSVDINRIGNQFAASDRSGNPFGELSGAETAEFSVAGADFRVEYGSPKKRGRDLFGNIVPWGQRWRTGANRATHFSTSADLTIGDLNVPAGEYTLFTIPEADGGTLIINKQTGQNGRSYDESRDLGRVPMNISSKDDITEDFTITVEAADGGNDGVLKLIWGQTVFSVTFDVN